MQNTIQNLVEPVMPGTGAISMTTVNTGEVFTYRDLGMAAPDENSLRGYDLFALFTANIIRLDVPFTR